MSATKSSPTVDTLAPATSTSASRAALSSSARLASPSQTEKRLDLMHDESRGFLDTEDAR